MFFIVGGFWNIILILSFVFLCVGMYVMLMLLKIILFDVILYFGRFIMFIMRVVFLFLFGLNRMCVFLFGIVREMFFKIFFELILM